MWKKSAQKGDAAKVLKGGFTLVELLVVITIVAILSTLAVSGYMTYRRTALLSLATDDLISQIELARQKTVFGVGEGDDVSDVADDAGSGEGVVGGDETLPVNVSTARCYGVIFSPSTDAEGKLKFVPSTFWQKFNGKKVWKGEIKEFQYEGCMVDRQEEVAMVLDGAVVIENISTLKGNFEELTGDLDGDPISGELVVRFVPPKGELQLSFGGVDFGNDFGSDPGQNAALKFVLRFGEGVQSEVRSFLYNLVSLNAKYVQESP